jgi:hypothetical protein
LERLATTVINHNTLFTSLLNTSIAKELRGIGHVRRDKLDEDSLFPNVLLLEFPDNIESKSFELGCKVLYVEAEGTKFAELYLCVSISTGEKWAKST